MYNWTALITSQLLSETPWNILGASLFFLCWFWTVGYETSRAGYTYLLCAVVFPLYYTTCGLAVAAMMPTPDLAALLFSVLYSFMLTLCVFSSALSIVWSITSLQ